MFLKTLTLKGFKSFADPTTIELEPGITVVVGPNGSGKSNVVDAVAWVLGAQGPKVVRSTKMDDVIFAGTSKRPALGRAEVSLTIDNSSRRLPVELAEVTITRTLFRTGESEYAVNGAPCRLLDVQELLSDAGVGRQQHVIVSQGQLDSVLQSRPEDRRMVIEEAAGVLKFRRRRERAERRLESSEQNLLRLQDLQREVRRQLRPLERQAEAARRHDGLVTELRALRLHLAGREIDSLGRRLERAELSHVELTEREAGQRSELARLDDLVATTETAVSEAQAWDGSDRLGRAERLLERQHGLANVVVERRRTVAGLLAAATEADVVASLEAEASRLASELSAALAAAEALVPERDSLEALEAELRRDEAVFAGEAVPTGLASARNARQQHEAARDRLSAAREAVARLAERLASVDRMREEHEALLADLAATAAASEANHEQLRAKHERLAAAERAAAGRAEESETRARAAADRSHALEARVEALQAALDEARARAGVERLAGLAGVLGTLADVVEIDDGCEKGFEAAVEDALGTVVVDGTAAARDALRHLHDAGLHGGVLATGGSSGLSRALPVPPPPEAEPLRRRVRSGVRGVDAVLDELLAGVLLCRGGLDEALRLAEDLPGYTIVTTAGDRLSVRGWRIGAARSGATRAALETVRRDAESALRLARTSAAEAEEDRKALAGARSASAEAARRFDHAGAARAQAQSTQAQSAQRLVALAAERSDVSSAHEAAMGRLAATEAELVLARSRARQSRGRRARGARSRRGGDPRPDRSRRKGPVPRCARGGARDARGGAGGTGDASHDPPRRGRTAPRRPRPGQGRSRSEAGGPRGGSCGARAPGRRARPPRWRAGGGG